MSKHLKIALTLILIVAAGLISTQALDQQGQHYTNEALKRSLLTFGVARGLNGVISVAQGTEVALQPAGIGLTFTPGEILDPLNDLVERFSWVMLMSSASIGIQKTLLTISAWPWLSGLTLALIVAALIFVWLPKLNSSAFKGVAVKITLIAIVLRLWVPVIAIANEWIYQEFLSAQYDEATLQLQQTTDNISRINRETLSEEINGQVPDSLWDAAKQLYDSAAQTIDIETKLAQYKEAAADASEYVINLIVVFIFQTVVFPLAFLVGVYLLLKNLRYAQIR